MQSLVVDQWINMAIQDLMATILSAQQEQLVADPMIIMETSMVQLIAQRWEWQMDHLTLIHLKMY